MTSHDSAPRDGEACDSCLSSRRGFLRDALVAVAGAAAALGLGADAASALPVRFVAALASGADTATYPLPASDGVSIDRDKEVILARHANLVMAFDLSCPHQHTALHWLESDHQFQCPKHKSRYQADGTFISGRATRNMDRFAIRREGANVVVDLDHSYASDKDPAGWHAAQITV